MESKHNALKWLPWLVAFFAGTVMSVHYLATLEASARMTNVSSTFAIAYLFIPFMFLLSGVFGLVLGFLLRALIKRVGWQANVSLRQGVLLTVAASVVAGALAWAIGTYQIAAQVEANKPQVLLNQNSFATHPLDIEDYRLIPAVRAFSRMDYETPQTFTWNGDEVSVNVGDDGSLRLQTGEQTLAGMEPGYLTGVDIIDVSNADGDEFVATLVQLRATSRRFVLYVHEPYGDLVYEETLEACAARKPILLSRIEYNDGQALVVDKCEETLIVP
ncbi:hypothetical protein ACR0ST_12865 [Aliidiomarina sp. Khilg15.8]